MNSLCDGALHFMSEFWRFVGLWVRHQTLFPEDPGFDLSAFYVHRMNEAITSLQAHVENMRFLYHDSELVLSSNASHQITGQN
jgi:hypothetical protein